MTVEFLAAPMSSQRAHSEPPHSTLKSDEQVVFYPTCGSWDKEHDAWRFQIHGKVFEPEYNSIKRRLVLAWLRSSLNGQLESDQLREDRVRHFLVDNERGKSVTIAVEGENLRVGTSGPNGHFLTEHAIAASKMIGVNSSRAENVIAFQAVLRENDSRSFTGRLHCLAESGVSVISDIDDTIKDSCVTEKSELLRNTFMREFRPVVGMAELYRDLAESGVAFHYVSGSPWQLYRPLEEFLAQFGYPRGTMHLKHFRLKDSSVIDLLGSQQETKLAAIVPLLEQFPLRRFILIGDSGEQDPEIYGRLARQYPAQVMAVYIRNVTDSAKDDSRFTSAFRFVAGDRWCLFKEVPKIAADDLDAAQ